MSELAPEATPPAPAAPKPEAPKTPAAPEFDYPADTPLADMSDGQKTEYWREKAQKHEKLWKSSEANSKDVESLRAKAKRLDEIEESQKSELQKAADKAAAAEAKASELEMRAMRAEVAVTKGVPAHLLSGATQDELIESADALLAFRGETPRADFGAGGRGTDVGADSKVTQLTNEDVKKLYAEKKYSEIEKAREEGRLTNLLGG